MREDWIFELVERDPDRLVAMTDEEFRTTLAEAGFDADALIQQFHVSIVALIEDKEDMDA